MDEERLDWIERWAAGWKEQLDGRAPELYYLFLPLEVATDMILELVNAAKDS